MDCKVPRCRSRLEVPTSAMGTRGDLDERMRLLEIPKNSEGMGYQETRRISRHQQKHVRLKPNDQNSHYFVFMHLYHVDADKKGQRAEGSRGERKVVRILHGATT